MWQAYKHVTRLARAAWTSLTTPYTPTAPTTPYIPPTAPFTNTNSSSGKREKNCSVLLLYVQYCCKLRRSLDVPRRKEKERILSTLTLLVTSSFPPLPPPLHLSPPSPLSLPASPVDGSAAVLTPNMFSLVTSLLLLGLRRVTQREVMGGL